MIFKIPNPFLKTFGLGMLEKQKILLFEENMLFQMF